MMVYKMLVLELQVCIGLQLTAKTICKSFNLSLSFLVCKQERTAHVAGCYAEGVRKQFAVTSVMFWKGNVWSTVLSVLRFAEAAARLRVTAVSPASAPWNTLCPFFSLLRVKPFHGLVQASEVLSRLNPLPSATCNPALLARSCSVPRPLARQAGRSFCFAELSEALGGHTRLLSACTLSAGHGPSRCPPPGGNGFRRTQLAEPCTRLLLPSGAAVGSVFRVSAAHTAGLSVFSA